MMTMRAGGRGGWLVGRTTVVDRHAALDSLILKNLKFLYKW
jgi:hypothetical protein